MTIPQLFVYGTLCPGQPNEHWLTDIGGTFLKASARGKLIPQGWGAALGYPGLIPDPEGDTVDGYVFRSEQLPENWQALDDFEGEGYERVIIEVTLEDGTLEQAYLCALRPLIQGGVSFTN